MLRSQTRGGAILDAAYDTNRVWHANITGTGLTLSLVAIDFDGVSRPRGAAYDIGAFER